MGYCKIRFIGDTVQVYEYEKSLPIRRKVRAADSYTKRNKKDATRSPDSIRRARQSFIRIVRSNLAGGGEPSLFTFTMHQKLPYSASSVIFTRFIARLRRRAGKSFRYIAVPEFQKRGAVHWHVLLWGFPVEYGCVGHMAIRRGKKVFVETCPPERKCERKTRRISRLWLSGFVDAIATDGSPFLAGYLAKYMQKAMYDVRLSGKRAYYCAHNVLRPMSFGSDAFSASAALKLALFHADRETVDNSPVQEKEFTTEWLGRAIYKQFRLKPHADSKNTSHHSEGEQERGEREKDW